MLFFKTPYIVSNAGIEICEEESLNRILYLYF